MAMHVTLPDQRALAVRTLVAADAEALKRFNADLSPESRRHFTPHPYDDATLAKLLARAEAGEDLLLGVFDGQRLVGYFFLWRYRQAVPLLGIALLDEYHGRGLGRQMMEILIRHAKDADRDGVELTTMLDNDRAFALYQKVGFKYLGNVENVQGEGKVVIERGMFYAIKPGAKPTHGPHRPPV